MAIRRRVAPARCSAGCYACIFGSLSHCLASFAFLFVSQLWFELSAAVFILSMYLLGVLIWKWDTDAPPNLSIR
jgi:hypothetical protein